MRTDLADLIRATFDPARNPAAKKERLVIEFDGADLVVRVPASRENNDETFDLFLDLETMVVSES